MDTIDGEENSILGCKTFLDIIVLLPVNPRNTLG